MQIIKFNLLGYCLLVREFDSRVIDSPIPGLGGKRKNDKHLMKARVEQWPKCYDDNQKDEVNSLHVNNDKISPHKFREECSE